MTALLQFRPFADAGVSRDALYRLYCQELRRYIEPAFGWDETFQQARFDRQYPSEHIRLVEVNETNAGALVCTPAACSTHVSLLILRPEYQGQGLGHAVMRNLLAEAAQAGQLVSLSCFKANHRALAFYQSLGLQVTGEDQHFLDLCSPG